MKTVKTAKTVKAAFVKTAGVGILALTLVFGAGLAGADAAPKIPGPVVTPLDGGGSQVVSWYSLLGVLPEHRVMRHDRIGPIDPSR